MQTILVTGTDTDVGKTFMSRLLLQQFRRSGIRVGAYKPACSGAELSSGSPIWHDVLQLREAVGGSCSDADICPQRFLAPLAPNVAARQEGRMVDDGMLTEAARAWAGRCELLLIEGAGGLLCPLSDESTVCDLAQKLQSPLVIVAANRLGVVNHTLLTLRVAMLAGLSVRAVILNEVSASDDTDRSRASNADLLRQFAGDVPLYCCGFQSDVLTDPDGRVVDAASLSRPA